MKIATKKRLIIFLIIFTFLIITLIVSYSIYCKYMFNKWIKPFCDNQNIMLIDDSDDCKIYNYFESETGLSYTLSKGSFPFYSYGFFSSQILTPTKIDENDKLLTNHTVSFIYNLSLTGKVTYTIIINEIKPSIDEGSIADQSVVARFKTDSKFNILEYNVHDLDNDRIYSLEESKAYFNMFKSEVTELKDKMFDFYGEKNFKE